MTAPQMADSASITPSPLEPLPPQPLAFRARWLRRFSKFLVLAALLPVVAQGVLGSLTALPGLPLWTSVLCGVGAQTFLVAAVLLAYGLSKERARRIGDRAPTRVTRWTGILLALVFVQLIVAAVMRHTGAGLVIPDFPTTAGRWIPIVGQDALQYARDWRETYIEESGAGLPAVTLGRMCLSLTHRVLALAIVLAAAWLTVLTLRFTPRNSRMLAAVALLDAVIAAQFTLGMFAIWTVRGPWVTSLHVAGGAVALAAATLALLRALPAGRGKDAANATAS